jgi:DNA-binding transcriptional LysR family regulator
MEMHQVRYFLAVARTLNFTRAAEQCNVSQPALTRAIRQLEEELAGKLLRREGKHSHLTDLGVRMVPLMQQCLDSALAAKSLATSFKKGATQALSLLVSHSIDGRLLVEPLAETQRAFPGLHLTLLRADAREINESLQKGKADFAIAGPLGQAWERLDAWALFEEKFELVVHEQHPLAEQTSVRPQQVGEHKILVSAKCESAESLGSVLDEQGITVGDGHQIGSLADLSALLDANVGIAFLPQTLARAPWRRLRVDGLEMSREVCLYGVAGRQRSPAGEAFMKLMRARDWSAHLGLDCAAAFRASNTAFTSMRLR